MKFPYGKPNVAILNSSNFIVSQWILPHFVKAVECSRIRDIDIKSAQTLKCELHKNIENATLSKGEDIVNTKPNAKEIIASPSEVEMTVSFMKS